MAGSRNETDVDSSQSRINSFENYGDLMAKKGSDSLTGAGFSYFGEFANVCFITHSRTFISILGDKGHLELLVH